MIKLILIRHTETEWSKQRKFQGSADIALNREGKKQAKLISDYLKNESIAAIYSSGLKRAYETAQIISKPHALIVEKDARLNEADFGRWEGKTFEEIQKENPQFAQAYLKDPTKTKIPEGESLLDFEKRVSVALKDIIQTRPSLLATRGVATTRSGHARKEKNETVVIVSHAGTNRAIICRLLDLPLTHFWRIKQDLGAVNVVEVYEETTVLSLLNFCI